MNGTPTCRCAQGLIAVGGVSPNGDGTSTRTTACVAPAAALPEEFLARELPVRIPVGFASAGGTPDDRGDTGRSKRNRSTGCSTTSPVASPAALALLGLLVWVRRRASS